MLVFKAGDLYCDGRELGHCPIHLDVGAIGYRMPLLFSFALIRQMFVTRGLKLGGIVTNASAFTLYDLSRDRG